MGIQSWVASIAIKKGVTRGAQALIAYIVGTLASPAVQGVLKSAGVEVSIDPALATGFATVSAMGVIEVGRNWLKHKLGLKWL